MMELLMTYNVTSQIHTLSESKIRNRLTSGLALTWTRASLMFNTLASTGKYQETVWEFLVVEAQHHRHYPGDHSFIILSIRSKTTSRSTTPSSSLHVWNHVPATHTTHVVVGEKGSLTTRPAPFRLRRPPFFCSLSAPDYTITNL